MGGVYATFFSDYAIGVRALENQEFSEAFIHMEKEAKEGKPEAQYNLGAMYYNGDGVKQDYAKAAQWYAKAGKQENRGW